MSREVILRIRPGESVEEFTSRIADSAPEAPPEVIARLRALLPVGTQAPVARVAPRQDARAAA